MTAYALELNCVWGIQTVGLSKYEPTFIFVKFCDLVSCFAEIVGIYDIYFFLELNRGTQRICFSKNLFLWNFLLASKKKEQINLLFIEFLRIYINITTFI